MRKLAVAAVLVVFLAVPSAAKVKVIATLFPQYDFARQVGGGLVEVSLLLPPGVEAHSFEPTPQQIFAINKADIFAYTNKSMEPWAEDILKGLNSKNLLAVDLSAGVPMMKDNDDEEEAHGRKHGSGGGMDPHIWLDLSNAEKMVDNLAGALCEKDAPNAEVYKKNAKAYKEKLAVLDLKYKEAVKTARIKKFCFAGHFAFTYFARRYGLEYFSPYRGTSPDSEPTPKAMIGAIEMIKKEGIKYIYYEEIISPRIAEVLAKEAKVELLPLNAAHNLKREDLDSGKTFVIILEEDLVNLKKGLECGK
jgi:zinc transport system substrate-binding protein